VSVLNILGELKQKGKMVMWVLEQTDREHRAATAPLGQMMRNLQ